MNKDDLFRAMNYVKQEWVEQARPSDYKNVIRIKKDRKRKLCRSIVAAAAAIIAMTGIAYTGTYAYQKYHVPKSNVKYTSHMNDDSAVNIYSQKEVTNTDNSRVEVSWGNYIASGSLFYLQVTFTSKDGTPIIPNDESDMQPVMGSYGFRNTKISVSNDNGDFLESSICFGSSFFYNGMSEDGTEIYAEMAIDYSAYHNIVGHSIRIKGTDLMCTYMDADENHEKKQLASGEWTFEAYVENSSTGSVKTEPYVKVPSAINEGEYITVSSIETDGFRLIIKAEGDADSKYFGFIGEYGAAVVLKDGTVVDMDNKMSNISGNKDLWDVEYALKKVVAIEDIAAIKWHGVTLFEAE